MKHTFTDIDIVQPCYNPLPDWDHSVLEHYRQLTTLLPGVNINLIIVNDGSPKNVLPEQVNYLKQHIPGFRFVEYQPNRGKGYALRKGIEMTTSEAIIYTDIDFPFELHHIPEILGVLQNGADVVSGVRRKNYYETLSPMRLVASRTSQLLNRVFLKLPFNDTQSGIKGLNRKGREVFLTTTINRYLADTEFLALCAKRRMSIVPHEVSLREDIHLSKMSLKTFMKELDNFVRIYSIVFKSVK